jgi:hypothetical protein
VSLAACAPRRVRRRVGLEPTGRELQAGFQQYLRCRPQHLQRTFLLLSRGAIPMCPDVLLKRTAEPRGWLYDLIFYIRRSDAAWAAFDTLPGWC